MPAKLIIQSDESEKVYWIDMPVLRIGSRPDCDIQIHRAGIPGHAITIEYRDGRYLAYNRSDAPVYVDDRALSAGSSTPFDAGQMLRLDGEVGVLLDIEGDPSPSCSQGSLSTPFGSAASQDGGFYGDLEASSSDDIVSEDEIADRSEGETNAPSIPLKSITQLGVIIFCITGIALTLWVKSRSSNSGEQQTVPTLEELVQLTAGGEIRDDAAWTNGMLKQLQYAERAFLRQYQEEARERFNALRDELVRHQHTRNDTGNEQVPTYDHAQSNERETTTFAVESEKFVKDRLSKLQAQ